jgi:hypothetical protein
MKNSKKIISLCLNVLILALVSVGLVLGFKGFDWTGSYDKCPLNFFTNDSNILLGISSLIYIIAALVSFKKDSFPKAVTLIRLIGSTATLVTFIVVVTILGPQYGFMKFVFGIEGGFLFLHFICPLLSLISFVFFESENRLGFWNSIYTMIPTILYGCVWIVLELINTKYQDIAPYPFLKIYGVPVYQPILYVLGMFLGTWVLGILHLVLHNLFVAKAATEPAKEEKKAEEPAPKEEKKAEPSEEKKAEAPQETKQEPAKNDKPKEDDVVVVEDSEDNEVQEEEEEIKAEEAAKAANPTSYQNGPRVYHIAKQGDTGKWQVRLATGQKAIKLFDTQAQAIDYAKSLVKTQGGSIRVHSLKGKLRKQ